MSDKDVIFWLNQIEEKYIHGGDEGFDEKRREAIRQAITIVQQASNSSGTWIKGYGDHIYCGLRAGYYVCSRCGMVDNDRPAYCKYCGSHNKE